MKFMDANAKGNFDQRNYQTRVEQETRLSKPSKHIQKTRPSDFVTRKSIAKERRKEIAPAPSLVPTVNTIGERFKCQWRNRHQGRHQHPRRHQGRHQLHRPRHQQRHRGRHQGRQEHHRRRHQGRH